MAHRRFGKTVREINELVKKAALCERPNPRLAYIAPYYAQAKAIAWDYLKHYAGPILAGRPMESELSVELVNGAKVRLFGADNPDALRGIYLDGVVLDEYGDMRPSLFGEVIRPLLTDRQGWASFIGTPKGKNHFHALALQAQRSPDWFYQELKASETGIIPKAELEDARRSMTPEQYAQEFECAFDVPALGAIYAAELAQAKTDKRITRVPYDGSALVHTAWDLGIGDATAIWFYQQVQGEVHLIDYYEDSGKPITHYLGVLEQKSYVYGKHHVPHDAAGRELGTGKSIADMMRSQGVTPTILKRESADIGINAARVLFARCWFDADACAVGLDALMNYRRDFNDKLGEFKAAPVHDWASHGADAFRYLAMSAESTKQGKPKALTFASEF